MSTPIIPDHLCFWYSPDCKPEPIRITGIRSFTAWPKLSKRTMRRITRGHSKFRMLTATELAMPKGKHMHVATVLESPKCEHFSRKRSKRS